MKKRIIALLLCVCMLLSDGAMALTANSVEWSEDETPTAEESATKSATVLLDGEECDSFYLGSDEKRMMMVTAEFPISKYQWQILADPSQNLWVNILDRTDMECEVSVALLESVLSGGGSTALRCVISDYEGNQVTSSAVNVTVIDSTALVQTVAETDESVPTTEGTGNENNDEETVDYVTVTIEYLFGTDSNKSGKVAAKEYVAKIMNTQWASFKQTVTSPAVVGYTAGESQVTITADLKELVDNKDGTYTYKVYYSPTEVNYTVHYYFQKIYSDEYDDGGWDVRQAFTETTLEYAHLEYKGGTPTGYYEMYYATEDVAADGSTVVECYFDRQYYLIRFDCNEGYGTDPIYARYGTTFAVNEPVRYGYTFTGWEFSNETDFSTADSTLVESFKKSMPAVIGAWDVSPTYQAQWKENPSSVSYKVAYWGMSGDTKYLLGTKVVGGVTAGDPVCGQDDLFADGNYTCGLEESEAHEHTAACYTGITWKTWLTKNYSLDSNALGPEDKKAFAAMEKQNETKDSNWTFEEGYYYVVTTSDNAQDCWAKLILDGTWYSINGTDSQSKFDGLTKYETFEYKEESWTKTWTITKYCFQFDNACANPPHTHSSACVNSDNYLIFQSADGATMNGEDYVQEGGKFIPDGTVTVKGDNSTVVNVYYEHKQYTLRFYYARSYEQATATDGTSTTVYQVVGGSTYTFGASAESSDKSVQQLLKNPGDWGTVVELPKLDSNYITEALQKKYKLKSGQTDSNFDKTYTYYYLEFTAGFGTDISDVWPVDIFEPVEIVGTHSQCEYKYAYFSAWNGQYGVYYSHHNTNQTIKGAYQYLDENLIFDMNKVPNYKNETTISYLCFWENGADVSWSKPKVFDYKLYKEYLQSDREKGNTPSDALLTDGKMTTVERNGTTYYLFKDFYVYDNSSADEQTTIVLDGYGEEKDVDKESGDLGKVTVSTGDQLDGYYVYYYYKAQTSVKINFYNYNGELTSVSGISYGTPLKTGLSSTSVEGWTFFDKDGKLNTPPYPSALETGAYEFMGWYTTADCLDNSEYDLTTETMPSTDLMLYAKWQKKTHTVQFYGSLDDLRSDIPMNSEGYQFNETHGNVVGENVEISGESGVAFIGWFYLDDSGNKCFFSSLSTPVKSDMKIYAEWRTTDTVEYTIYYKIYTEHDEYVKEAAEPTTGTAFVNSTKTFKAVAVEGAFPLVNSHSMVIKADPTQNVYTFEYRKASTSSYTVKHVNKVTGEVLETETVSDVSEAVVTVKYKHFENMIPDATQKTLILTADSTKNVITFYYTYSETQTMLTLHFMKQSLPDSTGSMTYVEDESSMLDLVVTWSGEGSTSVQTLQNILGFTATHFSYKKEAVDTDKEKVSSSEDGKTVTVNLKKDGTHVYLFYDRIKVNYKVQYLVYGTKDHLQDILNKDLEEETSKKVLDEDGEAYFGQTVHKESVPVSGYTVVGKDSYDLVIAADENSNIITFTYQKNNCTIHYSPVVNGQVVEGAGLISSNYETVSTKDDIRGCTAYSDKYYTFKGWYKDEACQEQLTGNDTLTKELMDNFNATDVSITYYALFEAEKSDLIIDVSEFTASGPVIVVMERERTGKTFYFVVTGKGEISIKLMDIGTYFIRVAEWNHDGQLNVENRSNNKIEVGEDKQVEIKVKDSSNGKFWIYGRDNDQAGGNT